MRRFVSCCAALLGLAAVSTATGQVINGSSLALQSSGAASGTGWTLTSDGYVGTYINLSQPTAVTFNIGASGTMSGGVSPDMTLSIADSTMSFSVATTSLNTYTYTTPVLAAGTYLVRSQLDNQGATATPDLTIGTFGISGTGVTAGGALNSNSGSNNAINAATTYADNFRSGTANLTILGPGNVPVPAGTQVQATLISNAFNFGMAVYGNSIGANDYSWINVGTTGANAGKNLAPVTSEQINFQNALLNKGAEALPGVGLGINMIVPSNAGKWANNEATQGNVDMRLVDAMTEFADDNNLSMRMHNVIWNSQQPTFVNNLFTGGTLTAANKQTLENDIGTGTLTTNRINYYVGGTSAASATDPKVPTVRANSYEEMDVMNEPFNGQSANDNYIGAGALGVSGVAQVYEQIASVLAESGAKTRLYVNEYNVLQNSPASISTAGKESGSDPYANWYLNGVNSLRNAGAPLGGVGMELYVTDTAINPAQMEDAIQNMSTAKDENGNPMPLTLSEFGVSGGDSPAQATYDTDLTEALTMMYGSPQATTFAYWQGLGGPHYSSAANYALWNGTYSALTAAGQAWQTWMNQWQTNDTLTTNANGQVSFDGTYGTYDVTIDGKTYTMTLTKGTTGYQLEIVPTIWGDVTGNFSTAADWSNGVPNGAGNQAEFIGATVNRTVTMDEAATLGSFTFTSATNGVGYNITGTNTLTLDNAGPTLSITLTNGTDTISAPVAVNSSVDAVVSASSTLTLSGTWTLNNATATLTKDGAGVLNMTKVSSAGLTINAGTVTVIQGSGGGSLGAIHAPTSGTLGTSVINGPLTLGANATLDLTTHAMVIEYGNGTSPVGELNFSKQTQNYPAGSISRYIQTAYDGGNWDQPGITSSVAENDFTGTTAVGVVDQNDLFALEGTDYTTAHGGPGTWEGVPVNDDNNVLVRYTYYGDTNLDGVVDATDVDNLIQGFEGFGNGWLYGDFNYDGTVNGQDVTQLIIGFSGQKNPMGDGGISPGQAQFLLSLESGLTSAQIAKFDAIIGVPEPTTVALLGIAGLGALARRRRI